MIDYEDRKPVAVRCFEKAYKFQMDGALDTADRLYRQSIALYPTAEGFAFYGWCRSFREDWDEAIALCKMAIEIDPDYGNSYNDIGAYLIAKGECEASIQWLKKALASKRYDSPFFAHYNLGQAFEELGNLTEAENCYRAAVQANPEYTLARVSLNRIQDSAS